jgi:hypothetical protein
MPLTITQVQGGQLALCDSDGNILAIIDDSGAKLLRTAARLHDGSTFYTGAKESGGNLADIKSKTDNIPSDPARESGKLTSLETLITAIKNTDGIKKITDAFPVGDNIIGRIKVTDGTRIVDVTVKDGLYSIRSDIVEERTFIAEFPFAGDSPFAANKQHVVIYNANATAVVRIRKVIWKPTTGTRTGAVPGYWYTWRRVGPTTPPVGGLITPWPSDTNDSLPASITCHNGPTTPAAGGSLQTFGTFTPQADEQKLTTLDAPTMAALFEGAGMTIYDASWGGPGVKPVSIRQNQTYEVVQTATPGTGSCYVYVVFTVIP